MLPVPSEFNLYGVYLSPLLVSAVLALVCAMLTARLLNRYRLSRFISQPAVAFLAIVGIYTAIIGTFVIPA